MVELARHLLDPILAHPEDASLQTVEGDASIIIEAVVHPEDRDALESDDGRTLRAIRTILSAAAGRRKATFDLVDEHGELDEE